jgi:hypothetical protein
VLRRLAAVDEFGIGDVVQERARARWMIFSPVRAFERTCARIAYAAMAVDGRAPTGAALEAWLRARADEALDDLRRADIEAARQGLLYAEDAEDYEFFADRMQAGEENGLVASVAFHSLPEITRQVFIELVIDQRSVQDLIDAGLGGPQFLRRQIMLGLDAASGVSIRRDTDRTLDWFRRC